MNEPHDFNQDSDDDPTIEAALSPLRSIEPTAAARARNRTAIAAALEESNRAKSVRLAPWWRRSISVPVPVAACVLLIISLLVASKFQSKSEAPKSVPAAETTPSSGPPTNAPIDNQPLVYRETATYVCGIGELHSTRGYFFKEQNQ